MPPAIEPRQGKKKPIPPPRPSKTLNIVPNPVVSHQIVSHSSSVSSENVPSSSEVVATSSEKMVSNRNAAMDENKSKLANVIALKSSSCRNTSSPSQEIAVKESGNESPLDTPTVGSGKALTLKKKNSLMSKRRKVSLKSFTSSDIQGHLYRRAKNRHGMSYWAKLYIVLIDTTLYGFKSKDANKADCLIFLPGFTVTRAHEVHSKEFAFKVYHPNKTFYFAAETEEAQRQWIDYIHQATLKGPVGQKVGGTVKDTKELFSETDDSDDENGAFNASQLATPSPLMTSHHGTNSNGTKNNAGDPPSTPTTTKSEGKYHLGFGSLKKSLRNLNSSEGSPSDNKFLSLFSSSRYSERKNSLDIPVPTSQFKSYRKMPVNVNLQAGTVTINNRVGDSAMPSPKPAFEFPKRPSETFIFKPDVDLDGEEEEPIFEKVELGRQEAQKVVQKSVYNHMHASNPNLVEFSVTGYDRAPKDIELTCPKTSSMNRDWDASSHNTNGFMTLKDLMLLEQAENAKDPYNKRVCLGIEKHDDKNQGVIVGKNEETTPVDNVNRTKINKIQKRSLPVTPDYAQSFKPDDQDILYTRSREGQKLRDFGYELITGDDRVELKNNLQAAQQANDHKKTSTGKNNSNANETVMQSVKKRSMNWMHSSSHFTGNSTAEKYSIGGSFNKKQKNRSVVIEKFDHLMASSEKLFHFKHTNTANETENLKSKHTNVKPNVMTTNWNLVENHVMTSSTTTTTSPSGAVPQTSDRGASYLTKLSFSNKTNKEKKLLGSPRLHRAIFGHRNNGDRDEPKAVDHESFSPLNFNNKVSQILFFLIFIKEKKTPQSHRKL